MKNLGIVSFGDVQIKVLSNTSLMTVAELNFPPGAIAAVHHHMNEEMNYIISGVFEGSEDDKLSILNPGDFVHLAGGANHNLRCISDVPGVILTVWTPSREDIMKKL